MPHPLLFIPSRNFNNIASENLQNSHIITQTLTAPDPSLRCWAAAVQCLGRAHSRRGLPTPQDYFAVFSQTGAVPPGGLWPRSTCACKKGEYAFGYSARKVYLSHRVTSQIRPFFSGRM